jgi:acyl-CoA synthetase (AMP-forming)/AMP-acid ligase II
MPDWYNVASHVRAHASERPDQPALLYPSSGYTDARPAWDALTYRQFDQRSDAYARGFTRAGFRCGDRVLMLMKPRADLWVVLFALFKIGAVPVILDPGMGRQALLACIERIGCRAMIAESAVHVLRTTFFRRPFAKCEVFVTVGPKIWWGGVRLADCLEDGAEPFPLAQLRASDPAAVAFTSGSTGSPKGVAYHQGMWHTAVASIREMLAMTPGDVSVQAFAAFAIYDLCWGHTAVIPKFDLSKPASADPAAFVAAIVHNQAKTAFASPIVWRRLAPWCTERGITLPTLDKAITTGAPTPPEMVKAYAGILRPGVQFHTPYGATEAIPVSWIASGELLAECVQRTAQGWGTCVGHPAPGIDLHLVRVTDDDLPRWSDDLAVPRGEVGEIVVGGGQVSVQYLDSPSGNAASKILDGERVLHRMGDLGYLDDRGRLWFCGRKAHRLETASGMVPCVPVEGVFNEHPAVFRTALVGVGTRGSEVPVLCVELRAGQTWSSGLEAEILKLADGTRWAGVVKRALVHPGFPTDARHNSKIKAEELKVWATSQG